MRIDYVIDVLIGRNLNNLIFFIIIEVLEEEEWDLDYGNGFIVFENFVFVECDVLGSCIYEFNFLYIFDMMFEVDFVFWDVSFVWEIFVLGDFDNIKELDDEESI